MVRRPRFDRARQIIQSALDLRAFPAAVVEVGGHGEPLWREAFGRLRYDAAAPACTVETIFDLASLTKVIATTSLAMRHVTSRRLALDAPVRSVLPKFHGGARDQVTIRQLLDHSSGLPAHVRIWERASGPADYLDAITALALERAPGEAAVYSDPGFMLLGFVVQTAAGATLDEQFAEIADEIKDPLGYLPPPHLRDRIAPTEHDPWRGRLLQGEVHDENAAALGGVAAHAGLFGTAAAVGTFARLVLRTFDERTVLGSPPIMRTFATRSRVPGSSRALGWDTMLPTSSCGTRMSPASIGHTGFTGTSLWIDPTRALYVVFLTNRVHPTRANNQLPALRAPLHDAVMEDLEI